MAIFDFKKKPKLWENDDFDEDNDGFGGYDAGDENDVDVMNDEPLTPAAPAPAFTPNPVSLKIINPKAYDDARDITEFLMNGNTILLNMDGLNREIAVRIIDYLKGAVQVVGGIMTKVGKTTLVVAPKNVDVSSIEAMVGSGEEE